MAAHCSITGVLVGAVRAAAEAAAGALLRLGPALGSIVALAETSFLVLPRASVIAYLLDQIAAPECLLSFRQALQRLREAWNCLLRFATKWHG